MPCQMPPARILPYVTKFQCHYDSNHDHLIRSLDLRTNSANVAKAQNENLVSTSPIENNYYFCLVKLKKELAKYECVVHF